MIQQLYDELKTNLTVARLKDISIAVISNYRRKDHAYLAGLARRMGIEVSRNDTGRLFAQIIQVFHPDKIKKITNEIEERYRLNDVDGLSRMKELYLSGSFKEHEPVVKTRAGDDDFTYTDDDYGYGEEDFGYDENVAGDDDFSGEDEIADEFDFDGDESLSEPSDDYNFIDAVTHHFVGNLDYRLTPDDLRNLDGELDLSGSDLDDLTGAEHCVHLSVLNLSGNRIVKVGVLGKLRDLDSLYISENCIEDISGLAGLAGLRELDISFNNVEDISPLLELKELKYLNIVGNPVRDKKIIDQLIARGIIVIY